MMIRKPTIGAWSGTIALTSILALLVSFPASAAEEQMEEIVVTGSFIKRDSFDSSSPLTVVDQAQIANNATPNLGEVMVNQTFNYGSDFQTNTYAARSQIGTSTAANLRGLGANATLELIDGHRTIQQNFNNAIPQIAIERIDILKDGASATYGTDAVAGVVNVITRKNFSGAKMSAFYQQDKDDDFHEEVYDFIVGSDTDNGHFTMAGSYRFRTTLEQTERPEFLRGGFSRSTTGNPGTWLVPVRDANGDIADAGVQRDPGCGAAIAQSPGGRDVGLKGNNMAGHATNYFADRLFGLPLGTIPLTSGGQPACGFEFGETWNYINPNEQFSTWMNFRHQFTKNLSNEIDFQASRLIADSRGSPQNPGGRTEEFPVVSGDHPGNPFRAFTDLNANGAIDDGERLYAQDANGDGVPDRGNIDANGDGINDVVLAADPFDPNAGIAFNEDVDVVALRVFGKIGLLPGANQPTSLNDDGSNTGNASFDVINYRFLDTLTYLVPDTSWELSATGIYQENHLVLEAKNTSQNALEAGILGNLVAAPESDPAGAGGPAYWNPFSTQALNCVDRVCTHTGSPDFVNTVPVLDAVNIQSHHVTDTVFWATDLLATGDLFDMPSGIVRGAFGIEYRKTEVDEDQDSGRNQCDWHEGGCGEDWRASQDVWSGYFELSVPAHNTLELTLAGRYTDYGGDIGSSFDPKFAALWQPTNMISVRASWSSAFIAPTIDQQFAAQDCGLQTMQDDLTRDTSGTFRVACVSGNPDLQPEEADTFNIGFSLSLLEGDLTLGVDYANYDFQERISTETGNNVLRASFARFQDAGLSRDGVDSDGDGLSDDVEMWIANNEPDIFRDATGVVTRVIVERINAQEMEHTAWDFYARYNLSVTNWGDFAFNVNATLADEYTYDLGTGDPDDRGDGVGNQNEQVAEIPPIPEWRVVGAANWFYGNHSARVRVRWTDGFDLQFNSAGLQGLQQSLYDTLEADDITYIDVNYKYTFDRLLGDRETTFEVGANNVTDEFPDPIANLGGLETFVHDVRGRMWYVRIHQDI